MILEHQPQPPPVRGHARLVASVEHHASRVQRLLGRAGELNYGQAMALSTILMLVCAIALLVLERLRTDRTGEF
jgi:ABC-type glycerol-3-phosphate transport system permease component